MIDECTDGVICVNCGHEVEFWELDENDCCEDCQQPKNNQQRTKLEYDRQTN